MCKFSYIAIRFSLESHEFINNTLSGFTVILLSCQANVDCINAIIAVEIKGGQAS